MKNRKQSIAVIFISVLFASCASIQFAKDAPESMKSFEKIYKIPNTTKTELYVSANEWFVKKFNSAESVIQYQDKKEGKIMGNYVFKFRGGLTAVFNVRQTISLAFKDNKVKIRIEDPFIQSAIDTHDPYKPLGSKEGLEYANEEWIALSNSLEKHLKKNIDNDW